jgi:hypothetical protein
VGNHSNRDREQFAAIVAGLREDDPRFVRRVERWCLEGRRWRLPWRQVGPVAVSLGCVVLVLSLGRLGLVGATILFMAGVAMLALGPVAAGYRGGSSRKRRHRAALPGSTGT